MKPTTVTLNVNRIITITLLVLVIIISAGYLYFQLPAFFVQRPEITAYGEPERVLTDADRQDALQSVTDPIIVDEGGMLSVLKSIPKTVGARVLTEKEQDDILLEK